jgi:ABC-2 type transport system ATP-binding protein
MQVDGKTIGRKTSLLPATGVLIERPAFLPQFTAKRNLMILAMIRNAISEEHIVASLRRFGLDPSDRRTFRKFSLGMKQRLALAAATMENPGLLLLDEPTTALDRDGVNTLREVLGEHRSRGALVVMASHDASEIETLADEIYALSSGRIVSHDDRTGICRD